MARLPSALFGFGVAIAAPLVALALHAPDVHAFGVMPGAAWPALNWKTLTSEHYAHDATEAFEREMGLRGLYTYLGNTARFKLLGETRATYGAQVGLRGVLYHSEDLVFHSRLASQLPSANEVQEVVASIAQLQRRLAERGQALVPVLTPGKAALYPHDMGARWQLPVGSPRPADTMVYDTLRAALAEQHVQYVDARALLTNGKYPVEVMWAREARHWTHFGGCLVVQEVRVHYTKLTAKPLRDYPCDMVAHPRSGILHDDYDLLRLVNAWGVPIYSPTEPDVNHPWDLPNPGGPSLMTVGTSFFGTLAWDATMSQEFGPVHMNYYNNVVFPLPKGDEVRAPAHTDAWRAVTHKKDLYILDMFEVYFPGAYLKAFVKELGDELGPLP